MIVFVDDILLGGPPSELFSYTKEILAGRFDVTDLGPAEKYLGWHVTRDRPTGKLWLSLEPRIMKAVETFQLAEKGHTSTPLPTDWQVFYPHETDPNNPHRRPAEGSPDPYSPLLPPDKHTHYRQGVGFINYAACSLRPDVGYAASQLSLILHLPRERHYKAMLHCLRYLAGTADLGLVFDARQKHQLVAYTDSDYARCKGTRKSVSGGVLTFAGGPIHWFSKRQKNITLSVTQSEYQALTVGAADVIWVRDLLAFYGLPEERPTPMLCDNSGAVYLSKDPIVDQRVRHVGVSMHFVRQEQNENHTILVSHETAEGQLADFLTKPLGRRALQRNIVMVGMALRPQHKDKGACWNINLVALVLRPSDGRSGGRTKIARRRNIRRAPAAVPTEKNLPDDTWKNWVDYVSNNPGAHRDRRIGVAAHLLTWERTYPAAGQSADGLETVYLPT